MDMKRKLPSFAAPISRVSEPPTATATPARSTDTSGGRRRQPQTSCDFCRHKKLKCDRKRPCSNCAARGQECHGGPVVAQGPLVSGSGDILERLHRLEQAVFPVRNGYNAQYNTIEAAGLAEAKPLPRPLPTPSPTDLDYPSVGDEIVSPTSFL
jgi:hypothetical protein